MTVSVGNAALQIDKADCDIEPVFGDGDVYKRQLRLRPVCDAPLPYPLDIPSFGYMLSPVTFSAQGHSTSELLRLSLIHI